MDSLAWPFFSALTGAFFPRTSMETIIGRRAYTWLLDDHAICGKSMKEKLQRASIVRRMMAILYENNPRPEP